MNENGAPPAANLAGIVREKEFWILLAAGVCLCYRPLFNGDTFFFRDLYLHFFPQKRHFAELLLQGEIPLWDAYLHGGQPLLANMNNAVLYPTFLLYLLLPPVTAFNLDIVLHIVGACLAAYALARVLGLAPAGSLAAGAVYGFCGLQLSLPNVWLYAAVHLPLLLLFWHLLWTRKQARWFVLTAITGVLQVLAGRPEWPPLSLALLLGWTLFYPYEGARPGKKIAVWFLMCGIIAGISLIQVLPMLEVISQSSGTRKSDLVAFTAWSIHPLRLPELTFPGFMGRTDSALAMDHWGGKYEDLGFPYMLSIYFGFLALLLATVAGFCGADPQSALPRRIRRFLLATAAASLLLSLGKHLPGFSLLHSIPVVGVFRYPSKIAILAMLPLALLAGQALDLNLLVRRHFRTLAALTVLVLLFALAFSASGHFASGFARLYFETESGSVQRGLSRAFLHSATALLACCAVMVMARRSPGTRWATAAATILLLDLCLAGRTVNAYAPASFLQSPPGIAEWMRREIGEGRLYRSPTPGSVHVIPAGKERYQADLWHLETLDTYMASLYSIPAIFHEDLDRLGPKRSVELGQRAQKENEAAMLQILSAGSVRYIVAPLPFHADGVRTISKIPNRSNRDFFLTRNERAAPRIAFLTKWIPVTSPEGALDRMTRAGFDARSEVVVEDSPPEPTTENARPSTVRVLVRRASFISVDVQAAADGYLVLTDTLYPGWKYTVDGNMVQPVHANYAFTAIRLAKGNHQVKCDYRPTAIRNGALASLSFMILLAIAAIGVPQILKTPIANSPDSEKSQA